MFMLPPVRNNKFKFIRRPNKILSVGNEIEVRIGQAVMTLLTINNLLNPLVYLLFTAR